MEFITSLQPLLKIVFFDPNFLIPLAMTKVNKMLIVTIRIQQ